MKRKRKRKLPDAKEPLNSNNTINSTVITDKFTAIDVNTLYKMHNYSGEIQFLYTHK